MKTQPSHLWILLAGALALGPGQGCLPDETLAAVIGSEPLSTHQAEAPTVENAATAAPPVAETPKLPATTTPEPAPVVPAPVTQTQPESIPVKPLGPAKAVTSIEVQRSEEGLVVMITGDGELNYQVIKLDRNRIILDLAGVVNGTKRHAIPVEHQIVRQIRIGAHQLPQPKLRLVLDLERAIPYTIEKASTQLKITLSDHDGSPPTLASTASAISEQPATDNSRHSVPVLVPERLKSLGPLAALAQPKAGDSGDSGEAGGVDRFTGKRISLDFQDAEISSVLRLIADVSGLNMVVGEAVKAKVTLKLLNVPWDQALDLILKLNNLGQLREGNILWIDTNTNITRLRDDTVKAKEATLKAEELVTRILYLNYADPAKAIDVAKSTLSPRGEIKPDLRTNSLVVKDTLDNLTKLEKLVRDLDKRTPQVQIEARVVTAERQWARGLGIAWGISSITNTRSPCCTHNQGPVTVNLGQTSPGTAFAEASNYLVNLPATPLTSTLGLVIGKFLGTTGTLDMALSAGETLSLSKTLSAPKVVTIDNKAAKIESGSQVPFQTTSLQGTQTTFVDATLALNVTPHIIPYANAVRLEIKVTKNSVGSAVSTAGPTILKNESTNEVLLNDGETTVIGGILTETKSDSEQGLPWFSQIPFFGWLFKNENVTTDLTELLIFVTPTILKD